MMAIRVEAPGCRSALLALLLVGWVPSAPAASQELIVPLQFSFSDPGARSMGFGGAFVALADDATAAFSNPAGLVQLLRPEISVEGRLWRYSTPYTVRGRVEGQPSGVGADTRAGLATARSDESLAGLSFLSAAYPRKRWAVAFYRHQAADFEFSSETRGLFAGGSSCCQTRIYDQRAKIDMDIVTLGLAAGFRVTDRLALGFGVATHDASFVAESTMFLPDDGPDGILGPTSFRPDRSLLTERNFFDDTDWTVAAGILWRASRDWTLGGVYRQGPDVELAADRRAGQAGNHGVPPGGALFHVSGVPLELPGLAGLGFAYRAPDGRLTFSFQWDRVDYSSIVKSLRIDDRAIDDVDEIHLGGEYVFLGASRPIALRLGAWLDPDHQMRATGEEVFQRALLPRGDDEMHYAAGLGVAFHRFQVDFGIDFSDRVNTAALSTIYSF